MDTAGNTNNNFNKNTGTASNPSPDEKNGVGIPGSSSSSSSGSSTKRNTKGMAVPMKRGYPARVGSEMSISSAGSSSSVGSGAMKNVHPEHSRMSVIPEESISEPMSEPSDGKGKAGGHSSVSSTTGMRAKSGSKGGMGLGSNGTESRALMTPSRSSGSQSMHLATPTVDKLQETSSTSLGIPRSEGGGRNGAAGYTNGASPDAMSIAATPNPVPSTTKENPIISAGSIGEDGNGNSIGGRRNTNAGDVKAARAPRIATAMPTSQSARELENLTSGDNVDMECSGSSINFSTPQPEDEFPPLAVPQRGQGTRTSVSGGRGRGGNYSRGSRSRKRIWARKNPGNTVNTGGGRGSRGPLYKASNITDADQAKRMRSG